MLTMLMNVDGGWCNVSYPKSFNHSINPLRHVVWHYREEGWNPFRFSVDDSRICAYSASNTFCLPVGTRYPRWSIHQLSWTHDGIAFTGFQETVRVVLFHAVSVRKVSGADICRTTRRTSPIVVRDPFLIASHNSIKGSPALVTRKQSRLNSHSAWTFSDDSIHGVLMGTRFDLSKFSKQRLTTVERALEVLR